MSISDTNDKQTAKQAVVGRKEQGIFTMNLVKFSENKTINNAKRFSDFLEKRFKKVFANMCYCDYN